jgi:hypothetical protein
MNITLIVCCIFMVITGLNIGLASHNPYYAVAAMSFMGFLILLSEVTL